MKRALIIATLFVAMSASAQYIPVEPNPYGERPVVVPRPSSVTGVATPLVPMEEGWEFKNNPESDFWQSPGNSSGWSVIDRSVRRRNAVTPLTGYRRSVSVPNDFAGKRVILRLDGVSHAAKLWVNGKYVRDHWGSFVPWTADITDLVTPGSTAWIALLVDETREGLGAFVRGGGLQDGASIYAVPATHIERLRIDTDMDEQYRNATLSLWLRTTPGGGKVRVALKGPDGKSVKVSPSSFDLPDNMAEFKYNLSVANPVKWDAEHPRLHTLEVTLTGADGKTSETISQKIGFREIERRGQQLFVNGNEVKFRGIWGGTDMRQLRDLNVNHTRQKWVTEEILDAADEYGIYILNESPIDFAKFAAEVDPRYAYQWMSLIEGLMERDYNRPSVVMWGLGNESFHGPNVLATYKYVRADDPTRPAMFSWPNRVGVDEELPYDVFSYHYADTADPNIDLGDYGVAIWHSESLIKQRTPRPQLPVLVDEAIHNVLSFDEAGRDPNVRNFWGESIKHFWELVWSTPGSLGGDQFGMYSDLPRGDLPEVWHMRKAYSPFVISQRVVNPVKGQNPEFEVENRYNHANLNEVDVYWKIGSHSGKVQGPDVAPVGKGKMAIPFKDWQDGDLIDLRAVRRADGYQINEWVLEINPEPYKLPALSSGPPRMTQTDKEVIISGRDFELVIDKYAGQITSGKYKDETVIIGGPHLQFTGSGLTWQEYWADSVEAYMEGNEAVVKIDATYSPIKLDFEIRVDGNGLITTNYMIEEFFDPPAPKNLPWDNTHLGGFSEIGVCFVVSSDVDRLQWERRGLWTNYPEDHIGREKGVAVKNYVGPDSLRWSNINHDWRFTRVPFAPSTVSNDFRSSKEYIRHATALLKAGTVGLQALSEEKDAVRMEPSPGGRGSVGGVHMIINNLWNYPTLGLGNYMKPAINIPKGYKNSVKVRMVDLAE